MSVAGTVWHQLFETAALMLGVRYYGRQRTYAQAPGVLAQGGFAIAAGCLAGAALGNKAAFWLQMPALFVAHRHEPLTLLLGGQSIVGGLIGGWLGVEIAKKLTHQHRSTGDRFVFPLLLGIAIGRIGCHIAGLADDTYGLPTTLPWGMNFGDGLRRHPTALYEILYCGLLALLLKRLQPGLTSRPGLLFKLFFCAYLGWRLLIDGLKPVPHAYALGLSGLQWLCLAALAIQLPLGVRQWRAPAPVTA